MKEDKLNIKKIPLKGLLEILTDLYEEGVNFIDISMGEGSEIKDVMKIDILPEYMASDDELDEDEEEWDVYEEEAEPHTSQESTIQVSKLSEDDLNNLL